MEHVDMKMLREKMATTALDDEALSYGNRALKNFGMEHTQENIKLVVALRNTIAEAKGNSPDKVRVALKVFKQGMQTMVSSTRDLVRYFKVPKANCPDIDKDEDIMDCITDLSEWAQIPRSVNPATDWVINSAIQFQGASVMKRLGTCIREVEFAQGDEVRHEEDPTAVAGALPGPPQLSLPGPVLASGNNSALKQPPCGAAVSPESDGATQQRRPLLPRTSGSGDEAAEVDQYIEGARKAFENKLLVSADKMVPTVQSWLKHFAKNAQKFGKDEDSQTKAITFPKFVAFELLSQEGAYDALVGALASEFKSMKSSHPSLFTKKGLVDAEIQLSEFKLDSDGELSLWFLSAEGKALFEGSALFEQFMDKRVDAKTKALQLDVKALPSARVKAIQELLRIRPESASLLFAVTWLGPAPMGEKVIYLMQSLGRFPYLREWEPTSKFHGVKFLVDPVTKYKSISSAQFISATSTLCDAEIDDTSMNSIAGMIHDPVAKTLLQDYLKMQKIATPATEGLLKNLYEELSTHKLGLNPPGNLPAAQVDSDFVAKEPEPLKALSKFMSAKLLKMERPTHVALARACDLIKQEEERAKADKEKSKQARGEGESTAATDAAVKPGVDEEVAGETPAPERASEVDLSTGEGAPNKGKKPEATFKEGDKVVVVCPKGENKIYNGQQAIIVVKRTNHVTVQVIGTKTQFKRPFSMLRTVEEVVPQGQGDSIVPAAGSSDPHAKASSSSPKEEPDLKKHKKVPLEVLFGKQVMSKLSDL